MTRKTKTAATAMTDLPSIPKELIDQFVTGPMSAEAVHATSMAFKKALIERALGGELSHHLGYPAGTSKPEEATNLRNGRSSKTVLTEEVITAHLSGVASLLAARACSRPPSSASRLDRLFSEPARAGV